MLADVVMFRAFFALARQTLGVEKAKAGAFRRIVREETAATGKPWMYALEYASLIQPTDLSTDLLHPASHALQLIGHGLAEQIKQKNLSILN